MPPRWNEHRDCWIWQFSVTPYGQTAPIRTSVTAPTEHACEIKQRELYAQLTRPPMPEPAAQPVKPQREAPTVAELIDEYSDAQLALLKRCRDNPGLVSDDKPAAIRSRLSCLDLIRPFFGPLPADAIKQSHVTRYRDDNLGKGSQTIRNRLYALFTVLRWAADDDRIPNHNLKVRVKARAAKAKRVIDAVADADVAKLIAAASDPRFKAMIMLAAFCGLRIGELLGLHWNDLSDGIVTVRRDIDPRNYIGPPKNRQERSIDMPPSLKTAIKKLPKRGLYLFTRLEDDPDARRNVKRASEPWGHLGYSGTVKAIKAIYRKAGVAFGKATGGKIHIWHSLRHAYGSKLAAEGSEIEHVMRLMGHADLRTTQGYITTTQEQLRATQRRVFG